jgi:Phosphohistidine phosphatase SixA
MLRHAKSSWKHDVTDHQRPLKGRGRRDAKLVSEHIVEHVNAPDKIVCSGAVRAQSTAKYFKKAWSLSDSNFITNNELYDFSGQQAMSVIKGLKNKWDTVMIVGHNHAFTSLANMMGSAYMDNLPTSGFVIIQFDEESWSEITVGTTLKTIFPRDLKE